ncbi:MAG TPA: carboxypeptidase-like regulatory domain-containing protein [Candidatus Eremiobacteraceae bacterium]|nr:carboxypeptidase-like regulatory domain-containing protein [Candidatus Eremiobacteraceae bacterium]
MKRMLLAMPAAAALMAAFSGIAFGSALHGTVIRSDTRDAVPNALVEAYHEPDDGLAAIVTTDANGDFSLSDLPAGRYHLILHAPPLFDTSVQGISLRPSEDSQLPLPLTMEMAYIQFIPIGTAFDPKHQARVRGVVMGAITDPDGRTTTRPLKGVQVSLLRLWANQPAGTATTDSAGTFAIGLLMPGSYTLQVEGVADSVSLELLPGSNVLVATPVVVFDRRWVDIYEGPDPCGRLVQPGQTSDTYIVCGESLTANQ